MRLCISIVLLGGALGFRSSRKTSARNSRCGGLGFLVVGDQGSRNIIQTRVAQSLEQVASIFQPRAILGTGDNIYENGPQGSTKLIRKSFDDIYLQYPNLKKEWFMVLGNRDWYSDANLEVNYTSGHANWKIPAYYYKKSFSGRGFSIDVFFIDTMIWQQSSHTHVPRGFYQPQKDWLTDQLKTSTATWKVVVGHHPPYSTGSHGVNKIIKNEVIPLMRTYKAQLFLGGHDHNSQLMEYKGQYIMVAGAGGREPKEGIGEHAGTLLEYINAPSFATLEFCNASSARVVHYLEDGSAKSTIPLSNHGASIGEATVADVARSDEMLSWNSVPVATSCSGRTLRDVEGVCDGDSCTVQVDTRFDDTCAAYCQRNGLRCVAGWVHQDVGPVFGARCNRQRELACDEARSHSARTEADPDTETMLLCKCG